MENNLLLSRSFPLSHLPVSELPHVVVVLVPVPAVDEAVPGTVARQLLTAPTITLRCFPNCPIQTFHVLRVHEFYRDVKALSASQKRITKRSRMRVMKYLIFQPSRAVGALASL